jgi:hypothetical protein
VPPISQQPKPIAETFRPVRPNCRNSIGTSYCAAIAGARAAKRCSIFRRAATASLSGIATSAEHTIMPAAIALQFDMAGEPDRQRAVGEAVLGRGELAPDRVAALAVERLAGAKFALGDGDDIATPALGLLRGLAAQCAGQYRYAELQPHQMAGFVHRGVSVRSRDISR